MKGKELAPLFGVTEISVSKWRTAKTAPRERKFKQLYEVLCVTDEEKERLEHAYYYPHSANFSLAELPRAKAEQRVYMKAKIEMANRAKPANHKRIVREAIDQAGVPYKQDYLVGDIVIDFMLTLYFEEYDRELDFVVQVERQIALLCNPDPNAEHDSAMAHFITTSLWVDDVILVVPIAPESPHRYNTSEKNDVLNAKGLEAYLKALKKLSVAPPVSSEELKFKKKVKAMLTRQKIPFEKKNDTIDCLVKQNPRRLIALQYCFDLQEGLQAESEAALQLKNQLKCSDVAIVIPDSIGISRITMGNGIQIVALRELVHYAKSMTK